MGKWTQRDQDSERLPEGVKRIGYDADTSQYIFRDAEGALYLSEPGSRYGQLKPVVDPTQEVELERPGAFNDSEGSDRYIPHSPRLSDEPAPQSFHDMLPPQLIASPTTLPDTPPRSNTFSGFAALVSPTKARQSSESSEYGVTSPTIADAVRRSALPKVQGVMKSLKRSVTSATKKNGVFVGRNRAQSASDTRRPIDRQSTYESGEKEPMLRSKRSQEPFNSMEKK